jgi:hypothetical protein
MAIDSMSNRRRFMLISAFVGLTFSQSKTALADITTFMNAWDSIPEVQISQGRNQDCGANQIIYDQAMQKGFSQSWPGSGDQNDDICWRRTKDPFNSASGLQDEWTRCASSSSLPCEIN